MALFEKRSGAPAGSITVTTGKASYVFTDGSQISVVDPDDIEAVRDSPYTQLVGGTGGPYVPPPAIADVFLKDGVLTSGANGLPVSVESSRLDPVAVVTANGTLTAGKTNPIDATSGALTMTLPTGVAAGIPIAVQKVDASPNGITISGTIRGSSGTLPIKGNRYETQVLVSEGSNSWRPIADHKTWASIDAEIASIAIPASALDTDGTAAANSDTRTMSQKAIVTYVAAHSGSASTSVYQPSNGQVTALEVVGHSFLASTQPGAKVGADMGAAVTNTASGGQVLQSSLQNNLYLAGVGTLRRLTGETLYGMSLAMWGVNDIAALGITPTQYTFAQRFGLVLRMALSRMRTAPGNAHDAGDANLTFSAGFAALSSGNRNATTGSPTYSWSNPTNFPGGWVAIWVLATQGTGAIHTFTLDGVAAGVLDTTGLVSPSPAPAYTTATCYRVYVPAAAVAGTHVIGATVTGITTITYVAGWQLERALPQPIFFLKAPRPIDYSIYAASFYVPTDSDVAAVNAAIEATCAEFDGWVIPVDLDPVFGRSPTLISSSDHLHPTTSGWSAMATAVRRAIDVHSGLTSRSALVA
jgi:hypothetical protein